MHCKDIESMDNLFFLRILQNNKKFNYFDVLVLNSNTNDRFIENSYFKKS